MTVRKRILSVRIFLLPIENLYQGKYFGNNRSVFGETQEQEFTAYQDQIEKILGYSGHTSQTDYENAKWLFANEFPINQNSLDKLSILEDISKYDTAECADTDYLCDAFRSTAQRCRYG